MEARISTAERATNATNGICGAISSGTQFGSDIFSGTELLQIIATPRAIRNPSGNSRLPFDRLDCAAAARIAGEA